MAPVPWFPSTSPRFGSYADFAHVPRHEERLGFSIEHPKYVLLPKIGMNTTPATMYAAALPVLRRLQKERDFDLIDAHYFYPDGVAAAWLGRKLNKPVVITSRGTDVNLIPQFRLPRQMILKAAESAAHLIAVSQALKDEMVGFGIPTDRITVLRNGVDLKLFHPGGREEARATFGMSGKNLLSVGWLIERKGHDLIISALPSLPDYTLFIAGSGPEKANLEALAKRLGVASRVRFLGNLPQAQLQKAYSAADALVLASSREGWPNVLLESMACGSPVIASNVWGNPEVVAKPAAGVLMKDRTPEGIAEGVTRLFAALPARAATRAYAEDFSWDATTEGQITLFKKILSTAR